MSCALYLTHPEVVIDPDVPVPDWGLNETGRARLRAALGRGGFANVARIVTSNERKARDTGALIGEALGIASETLPGFHENDRSSTGYLQEDQFWPVVKAFFAKPEESVLGWERARDAQARIVQAVTQEMHDASGCTLFAGHGGVGALLNAHVTGRTIGDPVCDSGGPGQLFDFATNPWRVTRPWRALEAM